MSFYYFLFLLFAGFFGVLATVLRRIYSMRPGNRDGSETPSIENFPLFFDFARQHFFNPIEKFFKTTFHPAFLKHVEKISRRFRIEILKIENGLHRLSDYLRGKRIAIKNGKVAANGDMNGGGKNAEFWDEMHKTKNGFKQNNSEDEKPA